MIVPAWHNNMSSSDGVNFYVFISIDIDNCSPNPCNNGGTCNDGVDSYTCTCVAGFMGDDCDASRYLLQVLFFLMNMVYINSVEGKLFNDCFFLSLDIDNCSPNPCNNGGACTDGVDSYTCTCVAGFTGDICEISKC